MMDEIRTNDYHENKLSYTIILYDLYDLRNNHTSAIQIYYLCYFLNNVYQ